MSAYTRCLTLPVSSSNYGFALLAENANSLSHPACSAQGEFWRIPVSGSLERPPSPVATRPPRIRCTSHIAICDVTDKEGMDTERGRRAGRQKCQRYISPCAILTSFCSVKSFSYCASWIFRKLKCVEG